VEAKMKIDVTSPLHSKAVKFKRAQAKLEYFLPGGRTPWIGPLGNRSVVPFSVFISLVCRFREVRELIKSQRATGST